jgi:hypothetical protein
MPALMEIPYLGLFSDLFNCGVTALILAISDTLCPKTEIPYKTHLKNLL